MTRQILRQYQNIDSEYTTLSYTMNTQVSTPTRSGKKHEFVPGKTSYLSIRIISYLVCKEYVFNIT